MAYGPWTREDLLKVLSLYCQIPFGKMHSRNPIVGKLASAIDRTPSAVAMKLVNFASLDPELRERGVRGMANISRLDEAVWNEFYGRWEDIAEASAVNVVEDARVGSVGAPPVQPPTGPSEVIRESKARRGQEFFRAAVLAANEWKCCITGIATLELLRASHITPWSKNVEMRLDPHNGLCLNALHDAAFDRGLITFSATFELILSNRLETEVPGNIFERMFESHCGEQITLPERFSPTAKMMEFHRNEIFVG